MAHLMFSKEAKAMLEPLVLEFLVKKKSIKVFRRFDRKACLLRFVLL